jgi:hypothetical protein
MELIQTIRGFHPVTKTVIGLTGLLLGLILAAAMVQIYAMSNQNNQAAFDAGQGLGYMAIALSAVLWQAFLLLLIIIAIYMMAMQVKAWIERYLNAVIAKLDARANREDTGAALATMNEKIAQMEKKVDKIEHILENVGE